MSPPVDIKFKDVLRELIEGGQYRTNRRPIWEAAGITSAALSQYLQGTTRPRLDTLVLLADFFGVSLDYLIRGHEPAGAITDGPFNSYVDEALLKVQTSLGSRSWLSARIGQELGMQIEQVANRVALQSVDGMIDERDVVTLENFSEETLLVTPTLDANVTVTDTEPIAGRFTTVISNNLRLDRRYDFLLPFETRHLWEQSVPAMRSFLAAKLGVPRDRLKRLRFRSTDAELTNGIVLYRLDLHGLQRFHPVLHEMLVPFTYERGWIGYPAHINRTMSNQLFSPEHLELALTNFRRHWRNASELDA